MQNNQLAIASTSYNHEGGEDEEEEEYIRDIHALTPPPPPQQSSRAARVRSSSSVSSSVSSGNFTSMSREFNALVLAGSSVPDNAGDIGPHDGDVPGGNYLERIREEEPPYQETNPLAIVPDSDPLPSPRRAAAGRESSALALVNGEVAVQRVKKEEVDSKISAWETAKIAKINNRFKREDAIINGWESEEVQKATAGMKKVERKLEEKRAKALEKMQNEIAKARRKAEERRASAEGKRGTKVAAVVELANLMRAVGRPPVKRSFF
ncbi:unnamed protein product [Cuscuta epithymum]|uniref:Remorin C-terminal domain-containing protein n=1 Tax=Cuscuta epithymum TaxID=186058 RepID=A0AAV0EX25_9ASTE|nr:unnamed protein product [Cuscuta epithymum]